MRWLVIACACLLALVYGVAVTRPAYGVFHDDGVYLVTAKALAEGQGYRLLSTPGAPPQTKYPVFFPWLLSLVWRVSPPVPANLVALKCVSLAAACAWFYVSWLLLRTLGTQRWLATAIVLVTAASTWTVFLATSLMSESVFAALLTCGLWLFARIVQGQRTTFDALGLGICLGLASLTRTAGVVPAAACLGVLAWSREWRALRDGAFAVGLCLFPWVAWVLIQNSAATAIDVYSSGTAYAQWNAFALPEWSDRWEVVKWNASQLGETPEYMWAWRELPEQVSVILAAGSWVLLSVGMLREHRAAITWVVAAYIAMMLVWIWPPTRFAVPLLPVLLWLATRAAGQRVSVALVVLLGIGSAVSLTTHTTDAVARDGFWPGTERGDNWRTVTALTEWLKTHAPPEARLAGNLDPMLYLATGRQGIRPFETDAYRLIFEKGVWPLGTPEQILARLEAARVEFLVVTPMGGFLEENAYRHLVSVLPLERVYSAAPGYDIFKVSSARAPVVRELNR